MKDMSLLKKALIEIFDDAQPFSTGVYEQDGNLIEFEKYLLVPGKTRIIVSIENFVERESLYDKLQKAIDSENYELAEILKKRIEGYTQDE